MNRLFIYGTLKKERILEEALGENHGKSMAPATLPNHIETSWHYDHERWPSIATWTGKDLKGEIVNVSDLELAKLDMWENNYARKEVETTGGTAWVYVFMRPGARANLGDLMRIRR